MPKTVHGITVPTLSEPANIPADLETMANDINTLIVAMGASAGLKPPAGLIYPYAGSNVPAGYLMCDGKDVSRTTYGALFAAIGTTYGAGDGTSTFTLPNAAGRVLAGVDTTDPDFGALGKRGGTKTVTLTEAQMPHHAHAGGTDAQGDHIHTSFTVVGGNPAGSGYSFFVRQAGGSQVGSNAGTHAHNFGTDGRGGNQPHPNIQPYLTTNYLISTGA